MKLRSKFLCLVLSALMVLTVCGTLFVSATGHTVDTGATYNKETYNSCTVHTLTFNTDDYVVIPFAGYAGGVNTLKNHFEKAPDFGFEPVGAINGDFFAMSTGYLNDYLVTNGEVVVGDTGLHADDGMTCIMPDGSFKTVAASQLRFTTYFNGTEISGGIGYVNRRPSRSSSEGWTDAIYYFDQYAANDKCPLAGVAVLCEKLDGTVLSIGGTLKAKVLSVEERDHANGINPEKDQFLLYVRSTSAHAKQLSALKAGDSVIISTAETVAESAETVSQATSILANIGYIVKDGKNIAKDPAFNQTDPHGNTYHAQWSAFGTKADGTWVFFSTTGASGSAGLTLPQLADYAIAQGCTNVIRLDGGGSTSMYLSNTGSGKAGYAMSTTRNLPDCLMVVKRSSTALQPSEEAKTALSDLMEQAGSSDDDAVKEALEYAQSVLDNEKAVSGDYTFAAMRLQEALSGKSELAELLGKAAGVSFTDYSEYALSQLREAYAEATGVFGDAEATPDEVDVARERLAKWLESTDALTVGGTTYPKLESTNAFYLTDFNSKIYSNYTIIFTPGQSIVATTANLTWSGVVLLRKNNHGAYVVEKYFFGNGNNDYIYSQLGFEDNVVPEDCLVIGAHGVATDPVRDAATAGSVLVPHGFNIEEQTIGFGAYFSFEPASADGHVYDWKTTKKATCTEAGSQILTCTICGETTGSERIIEPLGHIMGEWEVTKEAEPGVPGEETRVCKDCGESETREYNVHEHEYEWKVTQEPTCTEAGSQILTCKTCGETTGTEQTIEPLGHLMGEWEVTKEAKPGVPGEETRTCERCGEKETREYTVDAPAGKLGDVNGDDEINANDYMLVKRAVLHTYVLDDSVKVYADINGDGDVNANDYMLIKRAVLHTYQLPETLPEK